VLIGPGTPVVHALVPALQIGMKSGISPDVLSHEARIEGRLLGTIAPSEHRTAPV